MTASLDGQTAIVTAAGRGIGRGIALALAQRGATVAVNSYSPETTQATVDLIVEQGGQASAIVADATTPEGILKIRDQALETWGDISILVNNVGAGPKEIAAPEEHELGGAALL